LPVAEAGQEQDLDGKIVQVPIDVEEMSLHGATRSPEGRREPDVRHPGDERALRDAAEDGVHPVGQKELVLHRDVRRGDSQPPATSAA
jgi:hypothetical protein